MGRPAIGWFFIVAILMLLLFAGWIGYYIFFVLTKMM